MLFEQKETVEEEEDAEDEEDEAGLAVMTSISVEIIIPSSGRDSLLLLLLTVGSADSVGWVSEARTLWVRKSAKFIKRETRRWL